MAEIDTNTKLMLHCDGTEGSTAFRDETQRHTVTAGGNASITTSSKKLGSGAVNFDGSGDYLQVADSADWDIVAATATTWTIELWVKHDDHIGREIYFSQYTSNGSDYIYFNHLDGTGIQFLVVDDSSAIINLSGGEITDTSWHWIVLVKIGGATPKYAIYKDGVQVAYAEDTSILNMSTVLTIGANSSGNSAFDGQMDEIRIQNSNHLGAAPVVGLTDTLTVPTEPYGGSELYNEANVGTPTNGAGQGAAYYNNYIYFATTTDISRYGPLDGSPSLVNTVWTGSTLGTQTALANTTYPTIRGVVMPNHAMHVHSNNCLYVCDFKDGQGKIHKIATKKTTAEGDTNNSSAYAALNLPFGFYPTDIESYGTDLVVAALPTINTVIKQGKSAIFFWDTTSSSFYRQVTIPDPMVTALLSNNGILYIFSGNAVNGVRVSQYIGGDSVKTIIYLEEGTPPFAGAVEAVGDKIFLGGWTSYPENSACVYSFGSKRHDLPQSLHCPIRTASTGIIPVTTAVKSVLQQDNVTPQVTVGWGDQT